MRNSIACRCRTVAVDADDGGDGDDGALAAKHQRDFRCTS